LRWKTATGGERRFEAKGLHGMQPKDQTYPDPYDIYLSSPVVAAGAVYFGSGDGNLYALDAGSGELRWKFQTGDVVHSSPAYADGTLYFGSWDSYFYAVDAASGKEKWRFHGGEDAIVHNQVGFQSSPVIADGVVYTGCRDSNVYALDAATGKEKWRFNNAGSWVISSPVVAGGKVVFATSDSSLFHALDVATGKPVYKQDTKAFVFSSPAVAGDVVYIGVMNGTLEARDLKSGELLWDFRPEVSKQNRGWILTAERKFNLPILYSSNWREAATSAVERQFMVGSIVSSPLIVNGVVYTGSTDGYLYALE
jgi:outer membrane protein assembly factor BamB